LLYVLLLLVSGTPVALEVAPVTVLLPLNGMFCLYDESVP